MEEMFDRDEAVKYVMNDLYIEGDFDFMKPEELESAISAFVDIDYKYMQELGEEPYDEDAVYEMLLAAANERLPQYKTYLMRLVEDYMDFMEQFLVDEGYVEWE